MPVVERQRDRPADFLRAVSLLVVVLGHWLVVAVLVRDGRLVGERVLEVVPWTQWATWLVQVMPVFFLVGGMVNAASWSRAAARGEDWAAWIGRRAVRLLRPLVPLLALWFAAIPILDAAGVPERPLHLASRAALLPLWFLGVYVMVAPLTPLTFRWHRRFGIGVIGAFAGAAVAVDVLARAGVPYVEFANYAFVWLAIYQVGYVWHDGRLRQGLPAAGALFAVGLALLAALVALADYPRSMVTVGGGVRSNANPATVALLALATAQLGLIIALRPALDRWLARPRAWKAVAHAGGAAYTVYLWHMTALVIVVAATHPTGVWPVTASVNGPWWALRPLWVVACGVALAPLVFVFGRFERLGGNEPDPTRWRVALGIPAMVAGIGLLVRLGPHDPGAPVPVRIGVLALLVAGLALLGALHPGAYRRRDENGEAS